VQRIDAVAKAKCYKVFNVRIFATVGGYMHLRGTNHFLLLASAIGRSKVRGEGDESRLEPDARARGYASL